MKKYGVEFFGTFFLVLTVALSGNIFAVAGVLAAVVYAGAAVSGAHYNPAVSLAVWWQKKIDDQELIRYWAAQLLGGMAAALVTYIIAGQLFTLAPAEGANYWVAMLCEIIFTFLLAFTVLQVALPKKVAGNQYFGAAIGLAVLAGGLSVGAISGGAFNPAVGFAPLIVDVNHWSNHGSAMALYIVGPLLGGLAASMAFKSLNPDK